MASLRTPIFIIGILLGLQALGMCLPFLIEFAENGMSADATGFLQSALGCGFLAGGLLLTNRGALESLTLKQAFLLTGLSWIALAGFAALPFYFGSLQLSYTDAFFEAMSGLTTTGATIIQDLEQVSKAVLLWRALLQWFGGIGIIVTAIAVLPMLNIGGMQLFRLESSDNSEKILPRTAQIAGSIAFLYLGISSACALSYFMAGMSGFDAIAHAMTTIATGGFSTHNASIGYYDNISVEGVSIFFMLASSLPFVLYLQMINGKLSVLWSDSQLRGFLGLYAALMLIITLWLSLGETYSFGTALRYSSFTTASLLTGTGYTALNYNAWGSLAISLLFMMSFIGGCAGSTSCGIKIFRLQIIWKAINHSIRKLTHPHGVFPIRYNGQSIEESVIYSVMNFALMFLLCFLLLSLALSLLGLDIITALSASAASIANVGPGLGEIIGPQGTYEPLPALGKWILCFGMLLGRLEIFTVLVLFLPTFWRR